MNQHHVVFSIETGLLVQQPCMHKMLAITPAGLATAAFAALTAGTPGTHHPQFASAAGLSVWERLPGAEQGTAFNAGAAVTINLLDERCR